MYLLSSSFMSLRFPILFIVHSFGSLLFADSLSDDVNFKSVVETKKASVHINALTASWGAEFYREGDNTYFYKIDASGQWSDDRYFMVSAKVYHNGAEGPGGIPSAVFTITPLYKTQTADLEKIKIVKTTSFLPLKYERDQGVSMENSIQAALVGLRRDVSVPLSGAVSAFVSLEAQLPSFRWVQFPDDAGDFYGIAPVGGTVSAGFVFNPSQSVVVTYTLAGISGDVTYGSTRGAAGGSGPSRYTNYAVYTALSVLLKKWNLSFNVEAGRVYRDARPAVTDFDSYDYLGISASKTF